jgi:hypothetical protein
LPRSRLDDPFVVYVVFVVTENEMSRYLDIAEEALRRGSAGGEISHCNIKAYKKENAYIRYSILKDEAPEPPAAPASPAGTAADEPRTHTAAPAFSLQYDINDQNDKSPPPPAADPKPAPAPAAPAGEPLEAAVRFDVPGVGGVWLVPSPSDAERLGVPRGCWLTPADLMLLDPLSHAERIEVLRWMRATGGVLAAAPRPASRRSAAPRPHPIKAVVDATVQGVVEAIRNQALAAGWTGEHLERLAELLHPGDRLGEVTAQAIEIIRKSGAVQHYYNPDALQPWRRKLEPEAEQT